MRQTLSFNDKWQFSKDGYGKETVSLPHTWNAVDGQDGGNDYWRGIAVYSKSFAKPALKPGERVFIEFQGAAMIANVRLNGKELCRHAGGYSTFRTELTPELREENVLTVTVDNGPNNWCYPQKADFTFYGGLYRDVNLIIVPEQHFELEKDGMSGIKVTPDVRRGKADVSVMIETWQTGGSEVFVEIQTEHGKEFRRVEAHRGHTCTNIILKNAHLWNGVEDPFLYTVTATLIHRGEPVDMISTRFGCRSIAFDPEEGFLLNGRRYPLRGVSRHQDRAGIGNALTLEHHKEDMAIIREIGANTVRLAHYQQAQEFYDLCDENGIIVWAEIPYITQHMPNGRENTLSQMRELITQNYNHPSIVCWGLSNEITASGPVDEDMLENHRQLNDLCHELDSTRPTTMAHVFMLETDSPIIDIPDIGSYNLYFGWYLGELQQNDSFFDEYHAKYPDRVIGFSEYGADANPQFHASNPERGDYTEEYQCVYHEHILRLIDERPYLWATHVWNLFDFAADGRDEGGKKGENQKGLVTMDRRLKKDAFYLYKAAWSKEPFVHICGRRYADRAEDVTEIKIYSNGDSVSLYIDGQLIEEKSGKRVFTFSVPISGEHEIKAVSGNESDSITIRKVTEPNKDYLFRKTEVVNWFDKDDYKPDCYSIRDTLGALSQNRQTAAILSVVMEKAAASRGDVAKSTSGNANLQKMMAGMSLESLIKQAGDAVPVDMVKQLNAALQKIKKEG